MYCCKCNNDLIRCTCEDLEERLNRAVMGGGFVYRRCRLCKKHYSRCKCKKPKWETVDAPSEAEMS